MKNVLYIHGMGGGSDSRIPSILRDEFRLRDIPVNVVVRTYDFDPEIAAGQIALWIEEISPALVIGESLGSLHALRVRNIPLVFVSPSLNAPLYFEILAWLTLIPGVTWIFDRIYRPREGDRQSLHFTFRTLRKYLHHRKAALHVSMTRNTDLPIYAFFGTRDHYRRSGIVSVRSWKKRFGESFTVYDGTHFMEEEYVRIILTDKTLNILCISK